jgi:hypothetical protein
MKSILIVENSTSALSSVNESVQGTSKSYRLRGEFTRFGVKNRNERIYTADKFLPCLTELNERISSLGVVYGEFDHPEVFDSSLSKASHIILNAKYQKNENIVSGEIKLLSTYWGKEAKSLVDDELPIFVSSRAAGITESDGTVTLKKLFTYDIVADPGFATAKMSPINESLGFSNKSNFRIYEMSDESKINNLFNMNKNDFVTEKQLTEYSNYLTTELAKTKKDVRKALKVGNLNPKKLEQLLEYYEEINSVNNKVVKYLDYIADKLQIVVNENKSLRETSEKIIKHNDYLAENLEKSINYSEYLAESLDKNISYSEYLAENLDKNISYSEYLAENLDKNISYSEYLAENLDKNIAYSEYIAESLDKSIEYAEYIAENLDNSIAYSEYLAEHVEGNIAYSEYIAENLDDNIAYADYIAENLDKSISYTGKVVEKLNSNKLFENSSSTDMLPSIESEFPPVDEFTEEEEEFSDDDSENLIDDMGYSDGYTEEEEFSDEDSDDEKVWNDEDEFTEEEEFSDEDYSEEDESTDQYPEFETSNESKLSKQIDKLILEAKKRKASETSDLHFIKFLNKSQANSFYGLTKDEQEQVTAYINEKSNYFSSSDVMKLIQEALSIKSETLEDRIVRLMPDNIKPIWKQLNEAMRKSILSQARLYPELDSDLKVEHFWLTRNIKKNESKKLISTDNLIQEEVISDKEMSSILERFRSI